MEEPGGLQSMGSLGVRHDWATSRSLFTFMHWRGNGNPLQCSCLENPRHGRAWWAAVYGVTQSRTRLKRLSSSSSSYPLAQTVKYPPAMQKTPVWSLGKEDPPEKGMATHCSVLAWSIPWTEEPGGLQSMGWQRIRHDWALHSTPLFAKHWTKYQIYFLNKSLQQMWGRTCILIL